MGVWRSVGGLIALRVICAEPCSLLQAMAEDGVILFGVTLSDPLTADFVVRRQDLGKVKLWTQNRGASLQLLGYGGLFWRIKALLRRRVLLTGGLLLLFLSVYLPTRVLFIQVDGNEQIPAALILEAAEECGIGFGANRGEVRSERVKNALLQRIPQLQWVGVNTFGCSATISVKERTEAVEQDGHAVSRIVAARDGIISTVVCTSGNVLCVPGQAVRTGQTLISGYTDCGLSVRAERAQGEIFAFTNHSLSAIMPEFTATRGERFRDVRGYSLIVGKKRINLWKDSGISDTRCVKIYEEKWVTLPGGFRLPVRLAVERLTRYEDSGPAEITKTQLQSFAARYLPQQMVSGTILTKEEQFTQENACLILQGQYSCLEMIGRERSEEIIYGKTD